MAEEVKGFVGIDWCDDTLKECLPGSDVEFVEVRRFDRRQRDKRTSLAARMRVGRSGDVEDMEIEIVTAELRDFEYRHGIVDFAVKDQSGKLHRFNERKPENNAKVYDHFSPAMQGWVDALIARVNKEDVEAEVEEVQGNSGDS